MKGGRTREGIAERVGREEDVLSGFYFVALFFSSAYSWMTCLITGDLELYILPSQFSLCLRAYLPLRVPLLSPSSSPFPPVFYFTGPLIQLHPNTSKHGVCVRGCCMYESPISQLSIITVRVHEQKQCN